MTKNVESGINRVIGFGDLPDLFAVDGTDFHRYIRIQVIELSGWPRHPRRESAQFRLGFRTRILVALSN